jgi:hypothetical protein
MPHRLPAAVESAIAASGRPPAKWVFATLMLLAIAGCTSLNFEKSLHWPWEKDQPPVPVRMTDMWAYTVLRQPGQRGVRGFGGRLMFYAYEDKPVKVDGTLTVYAFDARSENPAQAEPERKFVFRQEDLSKHYSESKLGHSYSFWLPWDEVGSEERQITLVSRFESAGGKALMSTPSRQILPGTKADAKKQSSQNGAANPEPPPPDHVGLASYQENNRGGAPGRNFASATIDLPPSFVRQSLLPGKELGGASGGASPNHDSSAAPPVAPPAASAPTGRAIKEPASQPQAKSPPVNPDSTQETESSAHSARPRFPARRGAVVGPRTDPVRRQPLLGQWPSALPMTPRSAPWRQAPDTPPDAATTPPPASPPTEQNTQN